MSFCLFLLHYRIVLTETSELKSAEWLFSHYCILDINPAEKKIPFKFYGSFDTKILKHPALVNDFAPNTFPFYNYYCFY